MRCWARRSHYHPLRSYRNLFAGSGNQPLQDSVEVRLFFGTDSVTAHLPMRHFFEVQCIDELIDRKLARQIRFIAKDEEWDAFQGWLL